MSVLASTHLRDESELGEPVVFGGPFAMTDRSEIAAAMRRYERGDMGALDPSF